MLHKIASIKNVGKFKKSTPAGDATLGPVNVIFAENGYGKSTICAILTSLSTTENELIEGRRTLGETANAEILIQTSKGTIIYKDQVWSSGMPSIVVFDSHFIQSNVCSGDVVEREHRLNMFHVIIGEQGVALASKIISLDEEVKRINGDLRNEKNHITGRISGLLSFEEFIDLEIPSDLDLQLEAATRELTALTKKNEIKKAPKLEPLSQLFDPSVAKKAIEYTFPGLNQTDEKIIAAHLVAHGMEQSGEEWILHGLEFDHAIACPFCSQQLPEKSIVEVYTRFFSDQHKRIKARAKQVLFESKSSFSADKIASLRSTLQRNTLATSYWKDFVRIETLDENWINDFDQIAEKCNLSIMPLLSARSISASEFLDINNDAQSALIKWNELHAKIIKYNDSVAVINRSIEELVSAEQVADEKVVVARMNRLKACRLRLDQSLVEACQRYKRADNQKERLDQEKKRVRSQLDKYAIDSMATYQDRMNEILRDFGADYRIVKTQASFMGGKPSTVYQLEINDVLVAIGDSKSALNRPSFKNTLSSGDKSALAFAFFLVHVEKLSGLEGRIVVLDDPFSSLDSYRRSHTLRLIKELIPRVQQVIILSHDPFFLNDIYCAKGIGRVKGLCIRRRKQGYRIEEWDAKEELREDFLKGVEILRAFFESNEGEDAIVEQTIRTTTEGYMRRRHSLDFTSDHTLGDMIGAIRSATPSSRLFAFQKHVAALDDINEFGCPSHHDRNPLVAMRTKRTNGEIRAYAGKVLRIINE